MFRTLEELEKYFRGFFEVFSKSLKSTFEVLSKSLKKDLTFSRLRDKIPFVSRRRQQVSKDVSGIPPAEDVDSFHL